MIKKKVNYYASVRVSDTLKIERYLTISKSRKDCFDYINLFEKFENKEHFLSWCELHYMNPKEDRSWFIYKQTVLKNSHYKVIKFKLRKKFIDSVLRMYFSCIPIGMPYDTEEEYKYFISSLSEDTLKELDKIIN